MEYTSKYLVLLNALGVISSIPEKNNNRRRKECNIKSLKCTDIKNVKKKKKKGLIFDRGQLVIIFMTFNTVSHMKITLHNLYSKLL